MNIGWSTSAETAKVGRLIETKISFRPFISFLQRGVSSVKTIKKGFYEDVLDRFLQTPGSDDFLDTAHIEKYQPLLELIYGTLSPVTANEDTYIWAMSCPASKDIFYNTPAFDAFVSSAQHIDQQTNKISDDRADMRQKYLNHIYRLILDKYYGISSVFTERIIYVQTDSETGLNRYYRIKPDTRFIDVVAKTELPPLNHGVLDSCVHTAGITDVLSEMLPLDNFYLEGFTVLQVEEITYEYAIDTIKKILLEHAPDQPAQYDSVKQALKVLAGDKNAEFGLLPFLMVNSKLVLDDIECSRSIIIRSVSNCGADMAEVYAMIDKFIRQPSQMVFRQITDEMAKTDRYLGALKDNGIVSYAVLPVYYNQEMVGVTEIYSRGGILNYEQVFARLRDAIPLVAQLLQNSIEQFEVRIDNIIKEKFTVLQPAVQWKFNEVALEYMRLGAEKQENTDIDNVKFENVYPLFGAIDIRNSTVERNQALADDIEQLQVLLDTYQTLISHHISPAQIVELSDEFNDWRKKIALYLRLSDSGMLNMFLQSQAVPWLAAMAALSPDAAPVIDRLKDILERDSHEISGSRAALETSIQLINTTLNNFFARERKKLQKIYPCYFETFRTDGIEYDLYAGQTISPDTPFTIDHLHAFRLWQLRSMCKVTQLTQQLLTDMPRQLQTTQLIYVNAHAINISFRNDERHFDVDGSYNIRYQVIKKRIDKVRVIDTLERLTQPGRIAIVYFNDSDADEYLGYIETCRQEGLLTGNVERLELEELQGVTGLRAIRVTVAPLQQQATSSGPEFSGWLSNASVK